MVEITGFDKDLTLVRSKRTKARVTLYDTTHVPDGDDTTADTTLTGNITGLAYSVDSTSDIRRTCNITLSLPRSEQIALDFKNTWDNRLIKLELGVYSIEEGDFVWYNLGKMIMVKGSTEFSATKRDITLNLEDMMSGLASSRGSQIGAGIKIPAGSITYNVLAEFISFYSPYKKYNICEFDDEDKLIPYDLEIDQGAYPIDIFKKILEVFPLYEMYFDVDGVFTVRHLPSSSDDPIDLEAEYMDKLIISESRNLDFSEIKNTTEIWGKSIDAYYTATDITLTDGVYHLTIEDYEHNIINSTIDFLCPADSIKGQKAQVQNLDSLPIYRQTGIGLLIPIEPGEMKKDRFYVLRYVEGNIAKLTDDGYVDSGEGTLGYALDGETQVHAIVQEIVDYPSIDAQLQYKELTGCDDVIWVVNPDSPFAARLAPATGIITNEMKQVLKDGEYGNINTTNLCIERAQYENWKSCRVQDKVKLNTILVPWIDVNQKIQYTSPTEGTLGTYIVQKYSFDIKKWTMEMDAQTFYPTYPWDK